MGMGGPRGWPDGICELYWRTLSTVMNRIGVRLEAPPDKSWRRGSLLWFDLSLESVTCIVVSKLGTHRVMRTRHTSTEGRCFPDDMMVRSGSRPGRRRCPSYDVDGGPEVTHGRVGRAASIDLEDSRLARRTDCQRILSFGSSALLTHSGRALSVFFCEWQRAL